MKHDQWSKMGEENLGEHNIGFAEIGGPQGHRGQLDVQHWGHNGFFTLMKCIINDHWADVTRDEYGWSADHVDMVMSKIYYCWVRMLDEAHPEEDEEDTHHANCDNNPCDCPPTSEGEE